MVTWHVIKIPQTHGSLTSSLHSLKRKVSFSINTKIKLALSLLNWLVVSFTGIKCLMLHICGQSHDLHLLFQFLTAEKYSWSPFLGSGITLLYTRSQDFQCFTFRFSNHLFWSPFLFRGFVASRWGWPFSFTHQQTNNSSKNKDTTHSGSNSDCDTLSTFVIRIALNCFFEASDGLADFIHVFCRSQRSDITRCTQTKFLFQEACSTDSDLKKIWVYLRSATLCPAQTAPSSFTPS